MATLSVRNVAGRVRIASRLTPRPLSAAQRRGEIGVIVSLLSAAQRRGEIGVGFFFFTLFAEQRGSTPAHADRRGESNMRAMRNEFQGFERSRMATSKLSIQ